LEIVWSYLYSGREQEAWSALADMWPPGDRDRIRGSILDARIHGIRAQLDGTSADAADRVSRKHTRVFDTRTYDTYASIDRHTRQLVTDQSNRPEFTDTEPQPILLRSPPPPGFQQSLPKSEAQIDLVIDAAGKVRTATPIGNVDKDMLDATAGWKFIPAFKNGHAVACRVHMAFSFNQ
jgi:hypothetical protein